MFNELYITITGMQFYKGRDALKIGDYVSLIKEPDNDYDEEAIRVESPLMGQVGYVANSVSTVAQGTFSAGRIGDRIPRKCAAIVRFITYSKVIARVFPDKVVDAKIDISLKDIKRVKVKNYKMGKRWYFDK